MTSTIARESEAAHDSTDGDITLVDCDVHPVFPRDWRLELASYFDEHLNVLIQNADKAAGVDVRERSSAQYTLPFNCFYPRRGYPLREDLREPDGAPPGTDPAKAAADLFGKWGISRAILLPQSITGLGSMPTPVVATEIARASNDWLKDKWLDSDPRWRGAIVIAPGDPTAAVEEIARCAADPRFVAVYFSLTNILMGNRAYWPIYEAAEHYGLAITTHPAGSEGIFAGGPSWAGGPPSYYLDHRADLVYPHVANLASLVADGVFERFPTLKHVYTELGYAWLPDLMWRMDSTWKSFRHDTPWVKRPPSEYILESCYFTTQPLVEPNKPKYIGYIMEMIDAGRTMLFSSDYPHWDTDEASDTLKRLPEAVRDRVAFGNAKDIYGDRLL